MNNRWIVLSILLASLMVGGCLSTAKECVPGTVLWEEGRDPAGDAPKWIKGGKAAYQEAGVKKKDIPDKFLVYVGVSEDKGDERGAQFGGVEDMLKRYAFWLQEELDELLPQAAREAKASLPNIDTALGAYNAVIYPARNAPFIRAAGRPRPGLRHREAVFRVTPWGCSTATRAGSTCWRRPRRPLHTVIGPR
jgi:hypothetical protein